LNVCWQSFGFVSNNPLMKNITDYLVDEGSYEEDILLGNNDCLACMLNVSFELCVSMSLDIRRNSIANCHHIASSFLACCSIYAIAVINREGEFASSILLALQHVCYSALHVITRPSVCPSITRVDQSKWLQLGSCNFHHRVAP